MCGIAGSWLVDFTASADLAAAMSAKLAHRGPDSHDVWVDTNCGIALGHRRLAIVDLSEQGRQPMASVSGRYVLAYNGEIYNHQEIRAQLPPDHPWRGHSDTETLLAAIEAWGLQAALQRCIGMFAIALWDRHRRSLTLVRDRMGEKPLYYAKSARGMHFASELKALKVCPGIDMAVDEQAALDYLHFGYVPAPRSIYAGIAKLMPGQWLEFTASTAEPQAHTYWTLPRPTARRDSSPQDKAWLTEELQRILTNAVSQQMLSDVPLGAFLSGGIDSSLIVALMQRCSTQPVHTYSIGVADAAVDESKHAREIAKHLGTRHTELIATPQDALDIIPSLPGIYDEPFADSSQIPTLLLSRLTRSHVTVALSGDAGDELFGGYNRHRVAAQLSGVLNMPGFVRRAAASTMTRLPAARWDAISDFIRRHAWRGMPLNMGEKVFKLAHFLAADDGSFAYLSALMQGPANVAPAISAEALKARMPPCPETSLAQRMMWWDMQGYLPDDILVKVDRASMAYSLETRVPFLDHRVVEFALSLPMDLKIRGGETKAVLRELLSRFVPRSMFERPKQGFTLPIDDWLRGPLRDWSESLLTPEALSRTPFLDAGRVQQMWRDHLSGRRNHHRGLWTLLMWQAWRQHDADVSTAVAPAATPLAMTAA